MSNTSINPPKLEIRFAREEDCEIILDFIKSLADFEGLSDEVVATVDTLRESLFVKRQAEVLIGESKGRPAAFALFFHNYSTFLGKANLYLEDLYVHMDYRDRGYGTAMLSRVAAIAVERGCERLDWWCLDWNRNAIDFYTGLGAVALDEWTVYRLTGDALKDVAARG